MTNIEPMPKNVEKWLVCRMLHKKRPIMTGEIIWDEITKESIREIKWVCDICDTEKKTT